MYTIKYMKLNYNSHFIPFVPLCLNESVVKLYENYKSGNLVSRNKYS